MSTQSWQIPCPRCGWANSGALTRCAKCGQPLGARSGMLVAGQSTAARAERPVSAVVARPGGFVPRLVALVIDSIILGVIILPLYGLWTSQLIPGEVTAANIASEVAQRQASFQVAVLALLLFYFAGSWTMMGGTPGQMMFSLRVTNPKAGGIGFFRAVLRAFVLVMLGPLNAIFLILPQKRGLHDMLAGTFVIHLVSSAEANAAAAGPAAAPPPPRAAASIKPGPATAAAVAAAVAPPAAPETAAPRSTYSPPEPSPELTHHIPDAPSIPPAATAATYSPPPLDAYVPPPADPAPESTYAPPLPPPAAVLPAPVPAPFVVPAPVEAPPATPAPKAANRKAAAKASAKTPEPGAPAAASETPSTAFPPVPFEFPAMPLVDPSTIKPDEALYSPPPMAPPRSSAPASARPPDAAREVYSPPPAVIPPAAAGDAGGEPPPVELPPA